ncbi:MAG: NACHT domain-containing NTPase [Desmonostoc vinosum HA7617-LM4]|jgi:predicted NACHT family NTPase|nr:NACHT domain-containing NTPase [Desmonostoc vinosum HA7617-LM4]
MSKKRLTIKATSEGLLLAQKALKRLGGKQLKLEMQLKGLVGRSTIQKFFQGQEIQVDKFQEICKALTLESKWEAIAGLGDLPESLDVPNNQPHQLADVEQDKNIDIDALVQEVREKIKLYLEQRCGTIRVLDMTQPIGLDCIYTNVNILKEITRSVRRKIVELVQYFSTESGNFDRLGFSKIAKEQESGLKIVQENSKLIVLGKPGAGKTTFLKYLAIHCISGKFLANKIPIFITLKELAETPNQSDIKDVIIQQLKDHFITNTQIDELLSSGSFLILLDGLDEVREKDSNRVISLIKNFANAHSPNRFVITCRIAAQEYTFEQFTEVEVADFRQDQITEFINKWFKAKNDLVKGERLIKKLEEEKPIQELANNPLLLTLLCLVFEESGKFASNRSELYQESVDILLKKWDIKRNIERDQIYKNLSSDKKKSLLSQIALETFEQGCYFFKQKEVEKYITQYIENLLEASTNYEELQLESEVVLKSIEVQHGLLIERAKEIYSFSHLALHEYFTARKFVISDDPNILQSLANHITEISWREVFLLTVGMLDSADKLLQLMKQKIDALLSKDEKLQDYLSWVDSKSSSVKAPYKPAAVRAFYFTLNEDPALALALPLDFALARSLKIPLDLNLDLPLNQAFNLPLNQDLALDLALDFALALALDPKLLPALNLPLNLALDQAHNPELKRSLQQLKDQLPNQENAQAWVDQLTTLMMKYRNIGHNWKFHPSQTKLLEQYYYANQLLVDCLNSDGYISLKVRQDIENTLLLPANKLKAT